MWQNPDEVDSFKMAKEFVFFKEYYDAIRCMSLKDQTIILKEVLEYMFDGVMPPVHNDIKGVFWAGNYRNLRLSKTRACATSNRNQTVIKTESSEHQNSIKTKSNQNQSVHPMKDDKDKDIYKPPIVPQRGTVSASFEKFWKAYPRHEAKQRAIPALERALKKTDIDTILNAIEKQKHSDKWTKDNGQFIPHPATWLNGGCWDDEITVAESEPEKEYHPITPLTKCKVCGSRNVVTRGMYANCLNGDCCASFVWSSSAGDWREE